MPDNRPGLPLHFISTEHIRAAVQGGPREMTELCQKLIVDLAACIVCFGSRPEDQDIILQSAILQLGLKVGSFQTRIMEAEAEIRTEQLIDAAKRGG